MICWSSVCAFLFYYFSSVLAPNVFCSYVYILTQALLVSGGSDGLLVLWSADHGHDSRELVPKLSLKVVTFSYLLFFLFALGMFFTIIFFWYLNRYFCDFFLTLVPRLYFNESCWSLSWYNVEILMMVDILLLILKSHLHKLPGKENWCGIGVVFLVMYSQSPWCSLPLLISSLFNWLQLCGIAFLYVLINYIVCPLFTIVHVTVPPFLEPVLLLRAIRLVSLSVWHISLT